MKLPERVQTAIEILRPNEFQERDIVPFWYRCFLRLRPNTPPPLFDANEGAWTFLAFTIALPIGLTISLLSWWGFNIFSSELFSKGGSLLFASFFSWILAGVVGPATASAIRRVYAREREALGLPDWNAFDRTWRPSLAVLRERADAERFWLKSLWGKPIFTYSFWAGVVAFFVFSYFFPEEAGNKSYIVAGGCFGLCAIAVMRSANRQTIPSSKRRLSVYLNRLFGHGVLLGATLSASFWHLVGANLQEYPQGKLTLLFAALSVLLHLWDAYTYQLQSSIAQRAENAEQERLLAEAKLEKLKAQIEPHFIFNTLAHLRRLIATDSKTAERMAEALSDFLRANLSSMQRDWTTADEDFKLANAYLELAKTRIGSRLRSRLHASSEAKLAEIPPMMLLTLLENAIQHAVEPNTGATTIDVSAEVTSTQQLVIRVADTGAGFGANQTGGSGLGLANIRERLQSLYRGEAELKLIANSPSGVIAELRLPFKAVIAQKEINP